MQYPAGPREKRRFAASGSAETALLPILSLGLAKTPCCRSAPPVLAEAQEADVSERAALRTLAEEMGILPSYVDTGGRERHTSDSTREALLRAMGVEAATEEEARAALRAIARQKREQLLAPTRVIRDPAPRTLAVHAGGAKRLLPWELELVDESGVSRRSDGVAEVSDSGEAPIALPECGSGYHRLHLRLRDGDEERGAEQQLIVAPRSCLTPEERLDGRRVFGLCVNLYTLLSQRNWGVGDLTDLRDLLAWSAEIGAEFVGLNPLHALRNRGDQISPYSPVSRLFRNPIYVDVEAVPELVDCPHARTLLGSAVFGERLAAARATTHVDYQQVMELKTPVLAALHRCFASRRGQADSERGRAYDRYLAAQGRRLTDFATFMALSEAFAESSTGSDWLSWPEAYRRADSPEVKAFREAHGEQVDFHRWVQFEIDRQLSLVGAEAAQRGMALGMYQDLALGSALGGSDPWSFPGLFLEGVDIGAPPDPYAATGQNWALPPMHPRRLAEDGYAYWIALLRGALSHSGALRIDHVMGLFRQFWIPAGRPGNEGAYVRFPAEDLLGILALESRRAGALAVGEDLGTVPEGLPQVLADWGILSSKVLYFEQTDGPRFRPSSEYPARALVTVNTHDLPPLLGYWHGRDLELRHDAGLTAGTDLGEAQRHRARERRALLERLAAEGALPSAEEPSLPAELCSAVHHFLCGTAAALVGLSLDDLVGEEEPVNLPGARLESYPSWSRRLRLPLERLPTDPFVRRALVGTERS